MVGSEDGDRDRCRDGRWARGIHAGESLAEALQAPHGARGFSQLSLARRGRDEGVGVEWADGRDGLREEGRHSAILP